MVHTKIIAQYSPNPPKENLTISVGAENRVEDFRWSIAGNSDGTSPNIYSELIYNPIKAVGYNLNASYHIYPRLTLETSYKELYTYKGAATDFDYAEDNRTAPINKLYLNSDKGYFTSKSGNVYYHIFNNHDFHIKAGVGYHYTKELFYLLDDNNPKLQTTYAAKWKGPGFLLNGDWVSPLNIILGGGINYYLLKYNATANWNVQEEFQQPVSFIQSANGSGWSYQTFIGYRFNKHISANINWLYSNWKTKPGLDRLFLKNGETPETLMNGAFKKNSGWRLSAAYTF